MAREELSARVRELIRRGAGATINSSQQWLEKLDDAVLDSTYIKPFAADPVIVTAVRQSNRSNHLHWAAANVDRPGEPVTANLTAEPLAAVRDLVRRGLDEAAVIDAYRVAQNVTCSFWLQTVFRLTSDPDELHQLIRVSAHSIAEFAGATAAAICQQVRAEHDQLTRGTHVERRSITARIIEGMPFSQHDTESRLRYHLDQQHTAAVIWGTESTGLTDLDCAAEMLAHTIDGAVRPLLVLADPVTRWVWLPGGHCPDLSGITAAVKRLADVRIAVGSTATGIEGFRRSHLDALITKRMMMRFSSPQPIVRFVDIEVAALIGADPELAERFVKRTLGEFVSAGVELQQAVRTFIDEQCNASRAATRLFVHRNTLLRKLAQANELLPQPLEDCTMRIGLALEALHWQSQG